MPAPGSAPIVDPSDLLSGSRVEILYQGDRTRVSRAWPADGSASVICKEPLGADSVRRLRHELAILERLAGLAGTPQVVPGGGNADGGYTGTMMVLADPNGVPLSSLLDTPGGWDMPTLVELARKLALTMAEMHGRGVVHKDLNPANILVELPAHTPHLIDFDLATTFAEDRPGFTHQSEITGTLPYLAPEQTGRTGRPVDQRADMYALGATLYAVATGGPPFGEGVDDDTTLALIHDHLARVPTAPMELNPAIPAMLSDIIMRLLEKEPDRRYQSAAGLAYDLSLLAAEPAADGAFRPALGARDFPLRLVPPSRLVGRDTEIAALSEAFHTVTGAPGSGGRGILVSGGPGVGKSSLIDELRPVVTAAGGWMVSGKFDEHRQDSAGDGFYQALLALDRLLLSEPEERLTALRVRLHAAFGTDTDLAAAMLPRSGKFADAGPVDMASLGDPAKVEARIYETGLTILRIVVSRARPVVMVVDDLQWAGSTPIGFLDAILTDTALEGLLVVGAYRHGEVDSAHPLSAALARWERLNVAPPALRLMNLPAGDLCELLGQMLRLPTAQAAPLAEVIGARTAGNPFDTVELINALRRDGALTPGDRGWHWEPATIRGFIGDGDVIDLLAPRIDRLPTDTAAQLETLACLGGEADLVLLQIVGDLTEARAELLLAPALDDGLLVMVRTPSARHGDAPGDSVRFRHDRILQATYARLLPAARRDLHLRLARRLAADPHLATMAAEQYLSAVFATDSTLKSEDSAGDAATAPGTGGTVELREMLPDADERRAVAVLFHNAALGLRLTNRSLAERLLSAAMALLTTLDGAEDDPLFTTVEIQRHAVLFDLGRMDEADVLYDRLSSRLTERAPLELAKASSAQIGSLTNRGRGAEAITLGKDLLARLGLPVPRTEEELGIAIMSRLGAIEDWARDGVEQEGLHRADITDPRLLAICGLFGQLMGPAYIGDQMLVGWLAVEAQRLWVEHGPCADLALALSNIGSLTIMAGQPYSTGYRAVSHLLATSEAGGYEPQTSYIRLAFTWSGAHWFEPLENSVDYARRAREGLVRSGDLLTATYTYVLSTLALLDTAPTLDSCIEEMHAGMAALRNTGSPTETFVTLEQLIKALRGETDDPGSFNATDFDETEHLAKPELAATHIAPFHVFRAVAAAVFGDSAALAEHTAAAMPLLSTLPGSYLGAQAHLLRALALTRQIRLTGRLGEAALEEHGALIAELDVIQDWVAQRAVDAPMNFGHFVALIQAERAWATGDFQAAITAYDTALREVESRRRPWHHALIAERAARFHQHHGLRRSFRLLMAEAHRIYRDWGATGKVAVLQGLYPFLHGDNPIQQTTGRRRSYGYGGSIDVSTEAIDLLAVLKASQVLSSETNLDRLQGRVTEVLQAMTGATTVQLLQCDDQQQWSLSLPSGQGSPADPPDGDDTGTSIAEEARALPVQAAAAAGLLPLSAFRYAQRTQQPLLVSDATTDDRFASDPYLAGLEHCSLLIMPILTQGAPRAMLILENRLSRGAFSLDRLDAVALITAQLAVSLDNAKNYASLEEKVAQRTHDLQAANQKLERLTITDTLTGLANRRHLDQVLAAEWVRALRPKSSLGLAMVDIDHFKLYNDQYGHQAGDACLAKVAAALADSVRDTDLVARYGGEEFTIVLPGTSNATTAQQVAERVRVSVADLAIPHAGSPSGIVTVSIGIATTIPDTDHSPEELIQAADTLLYRAKHEGRNKVITD